MKWVLVHPAYPIPPVLSQEERDIVVELQRADASGVTVGLLTFTLKDASIMPKETFIKNDAERLSWKELRRCRWGARHELEFDGPHEACRSAVRPDSPYVTDEDLEAVLNPKLALDEKPVVDSAVHSEPEKAIRTTERMLENGFAVFRTMVRHHREYPHLIPERFRAACARFDGEPIDDVPNRLPADDDVVRA